MYRVEILGVFGVQIRFPIENLSSTGYSFSKTWGLCIIHTREIGLRWPWLPMTSMNRGCYLSLPSEAETKRKLPDRPTQVPGPLLDKRPTSSNPSDPSLFAISRFRRRRSPTFTSKPVWTDPRLGRLSFPFWILRGGLKCSGLSSKRERVKKFLILRQRCSFFYITILPVKWCRPKTPLFFLSNVRILKLNSNVFPGIEL